MRKINTSVFIKILLALVSCRADSFKNSLQLSNVENIRINPKITSNNLGKESLYILSYTKLETTAKSLISDISKILYKNGLFYILDRKFNKLTVFKEEGKYVRNIGAIGRGPGEFLSIEDVAFNKDSTSIFVLSNDSQKLVEFSLDGQFKKEVRTGIRASNFGVLNDDFFFYTNKNISTNAKNFNLVGTNAIGEVRNRFFKYLDEKDYSIGYSGFISRNKDGLLYNSSFSDTVYQITSRSIYSKYIFDFGDHKIPQDIRSSNKAIAKTKYSFLGKEFFEFEQGIIFKHRDVDTLKTTFIPDPHFKKKLSKIDLEFPFVDVVGIKKENSLVSFIQPSVLVLYKRKPFVSNMYNSYASLRSLKGRIAIGDNPILVTYKLK